MRCRKCKSINIEKVGETCDEARENGKFRDEYYRDGSYYGEVGYHGIGYRCTDCGHMDADVCIHD